MNLFFMPTERKRICSSSGTWQNMNATNIMTLMQIIQKSNVDMEQLKTATATNEIMLLKKKVLP
jgi:hypothetical protein